MNSQQMFVSFSQSTLHPRSFYPILMCLFVRLFFSLSFPLSSHLISVPLFLCSSVQPPHLLSSSLLALHSSVISTSIITFPSCVLPSPSSLSFSFHLCISTSSPFFCPDLYCPLLLCFIRIYVLFSSLLFLFSLLSISFPLLSSPFLHSPFPPFPILYSPSLLSSSLLSLIF